MLSYRVCLLVSHNYKQLAHSDHSKLAALIRCKISYLKNKYIRSIEQQMPSKNQRQDSKFSKKKDPQINWMVHKILSFLVPQKVQTAFYNEEIVLHANHCYPHLW